MTQLGWLGRKTSTETNKIYDCGSSWTSILFFHIIIYFYIPFHSLLQIKNKCQTTFSKNYLNEMPQEKMPPSWHVLIVKAQISLCIICPLPESLVTTEYTDVQLILIISKSKGLSEILRDIHTLTYQICRNEEKLNWTTTFHKWIYNLTPEIRDILKILWKRGAISPLFHNILLPVVRFSCLNRDKIFSLR